LLQIGACDENRKYTPFSKNGGGFTQWRVDDLVGR